MQKCFIVFRTYNNNLSQVKEIVNIFRDLRKAISYKEAAEKHFYWLVGQCSNEAPEASVHDIIEDYVRESDSYHLLDNGLPKELPPFDLAYVVEQFEVIA